MQQITNNLVDNDLSKPSSEEFLNKFRPELKEEVKKREQQRIDERNFYLSKLPKGLSKDELKARQEDIDKNLEKQYELKSLKIPKELGENGTLIAEHKNKLAFIFIGDVKKAEDSTKYKVNAPKISMIVGGGLETTHDPKTNELISIDPRQNYIPGIGAQLHISSFSDVNVDGVLPISTLKNRSAIQAEADVLDLAASEIVFIRSLGRPYNSKGARVLTPGGVHIISGQNSGDVKIKPPEPMVLGKGLSDTLYNMAEQIGQINSVLLNLCEDVLSLKVALLAHIHPTLGSPSPDLIAQVSPTIASKSALAVSNCYSNLVNIETLKTNKLTALSPETFLSAFNRVN